MYNFYSVSTIGGKTFVKISGDSTQTGEALYSMKFRSAFMAVSALSCSLCF